MTATISVALCTYNGDHYLREQLDSIVSQTVQPAEIVIRDDGSTDRTVVLLNQFVTECQTTHPNIQIRILPSDRNLGVALNFMTCARACSGTIIIFADQDDIWHLDRLEKFSRAFSQIFIDKTDSVAMLSDGRIVDEKGHPTGQSLWRSHFFTPKEQTEVQAGQAEKVLARHLIVTGSALAIRRDWLADIPDPAPEFYHDEWLGWFAGNNLRLLPEATFDYRQHDAQQTGIHTTLKAKWAHLKASQRQSKALLERDLMRFPNLAEALANKGLPDRAELVRSKLSFISWRLQLPRNFIIRSLKIAIKLLIGDYQRYAIAHRSLIKDLFVNFPE